jgi:hypothetical protein
VTAALQRIVSDAEGRALMAGVQMESLVRADYTRDYLPLEKYGLESYVVRPAKP